MSDDGGGAYFCTLAVVDGQLTRDVNITIEDGRFVDVKGNEQPRSGAVHLNGITVAGFANTHSHAFHRALRSRTQADTGTFWTWRELMYTAAERLTPDNYHRLARATFAEMALAGISCVGEFHYVHHQLDGTAYGDPNAMGNALLDAATDAGIRITLLDTLYLHGGFDVDGYAAPKGAQQRYRDASVDAWVQRVEQLAPASNHHIGAAIHSVRAVDPEAAATIAKWARSNDAVLHAHVSEQRAENDRCIEAHGVTPTGLLQDVGALGPNFTAVHATHLIDADMAAFAQSGSTVCLCPTTERDLGDGIGPTSELANAGVALALGSDSHAIIDPFEECRAMELDERLRSEERGIHSASELLRAATVNGHRSLGWSEAGDITVGHRADLVSVDLRSVRTAGSADQTAIEALVFAASACDVTDVVVDGTPIVRSRAHCTIDVAAELQDSITALMVP